MDYDSKLGYEICIPWINLICSSYSFILIFFFYITYLAKQKFVIKKIKLIVLKNLTNMYKICHEIILICVLFNAIFNIYKLFLYI